MASIAVRRFTGDRTDKYGAALVPGSSTWTVDNVHIAPQSSSQAGIDEINDRDREGQVEGKVLYCPLGTDIRHDDQVTLADGTVWEVAAPPMEWRGRWSGRGGMQATIRRAEG